MRLSIEKYWNWEEDGLFSLFSLVGKIQGLPHRFKNSRATQCFRGSPLNLPAIRKVQNQDEDETSYFFLEFEKPAGHKFQSWEFQAHERPGTVGMQITETLALLLRYPGKITWT